MSNLFTILPFSAGNQSLPLIPSTDYKRLSDLEISAYDHWIFDKGGASNLSGSVNGKLLTAQSSSPSYSSNYLSILSDQGKGLLTDLGEVATQTDTICVVFRYASSTGIIVPFGSLSTTPEASLGGGSPYLANAARDVLLQYRGTSASSTDTGKDLPSGSWHFLAVSRNLAAGGSIRTLVGGQVANEVTLTAQSAYIPAGNGSRKIALGSAYYNAVAGVNLDFAEAVIFNRQLSATEMAGVYDRAKARMSARGITVV